MEAGTSTVEGTITPERIKQAIQTLSPTLTVESVTVASQAQLDALETTNRLEFATVTTAFGSWSVGDVLLYDHGASAWERILNLGSVSVAAINLAATLVANQIHDHQFGAERTQTIASADIVTALEALAFR